MKGERQRKRERGEGEREREKDSLQAPELSHADP